MFSFIRYSLRGYLSLISRNPEKVLGPGPWLVLPGDGANRTLDGVPAFSPAGGSGDNHMIRISGRHAHFVLLRSQYSNRRIYRCTAAQKDKRAPTTHGSDRMYRGSTPTTRRESETRKLQPGHPACRTTEQGLRRIGDENWWEVSRNPQLQSLIRRHSRITMMGSHCRGPGCSKPKAQLGSTRALSCPPSAAAVTSTSRSKARISVRSPCLYERTQRQLTVPPRVEPGFLGTSIARHPQAGKSDSARQRLG